MSQSLTLQWGARRRRSPMDHATLKDGPPRSYSMPCSPPQTEEESGPRRKRPSRQAASGKRQRPPPPDEAPAECDAPSATRLALLIKEPWVSLIGHGKKTWELRGRRTHKRGRVALVASRTGGWITGGATLVDCRGPLTQAQLAASEELHCVSGAAPGRYRETYAWVFADALQLPQPVRYQHPPGAVIWVNLDTPVVV